MIVATLKKLSRLWLVALAVAWAFDGLFWKKTPGISFMILVFLLLAGGFLLAWGEKLRPARSSLILLIPLGFFAAITFFRLEPLTVLLSYLLSLWLLMLLAHTFLGGRWFLYGVVDHLAAFFSLLGSAFYRAASAWSKERAQRAAQPADAGQSSRAWRRALPLLRGLLLALPVVGVFAALLSSADPIFSRRLEDFLSIFRIDKLSEYIFRLTYVLFLAYTLAGVYLHALTASHTEPLRGLDKPLVAPFLGLAEPAIILGSVELLFASFVGIQIRYFFGGQANIVAEGFTYSEYARRGFGELLAVAFFSLLLFLGLSAITRRETPRQHWLFSGLGIILVALVAIILVSGFQRLNLYEEAYGFTRLRTYTHVFMIWVGILLAAVVGLDLAGKLRYFALAVMFFCLGFVASLSLLNVDGFIAHANVQRAAAGSELDMQYLAALSADSIPGLIDLHRSASLPPQVQEQVSGVLACQAAALGVARNGQLVDAEPWQSFHFSRSRARRLLEGYQEALKDTPVRRDEQGWVVKIGDGEQPCFAVRQD